MLVQMPEIIYVSEFYVEQFIWTDFFRFVQLWFRQTHINSSKQTFKRNPRGLKSSFVHFYIVDLQCMSYGP